MRWLVLLLVLPLLSGCGARRAEPLQLAPWVARTPNVVVVFVDDLGWGDLGCYGAAPLPDGSSVTPHLDALAESGTRFTRFYVSQPVCSASRASLLTGCYANRVGIHGALGPGSRAGLSAAETTLAEVCASRGYRTACFGKWHLGHHPEFLPTRHGFEEFAGIPYSNDMWPHHPESPSAWPPLPWIEGETAVATLDDQSAMTGELTDRAVEFIERCGARDERFFLYLAHPQPHVPLFAGEPFGGATGQGLYRDVVRELDASVGRLVETLERSGQRENTLVLFASDNGPWLSYGDHAGSTGGLREGKGTTFEGGVRVPAIASWPGHVPEGALLSEPLMTIDVLPTVAGLIGAELPELPIDGEDVWPVIAEGRGNGDRAYAFWYHRDELEAVMRGRHKLHTPHRYRSMVGGTAGNGGFEGAYVWNARIEGGLFDLLSDPGETNDLSASRPDSRTELEALAEGFRARLGDRLREVTGSEPRPVGRVPEDRFVELPEGIEDLRSQIQRRAADGELDPLWRSLVDRRRVPFVEENRALLVWRGEAERVEVLGIDAPLRNGAARPLDRLAGTDWWLTELELPRDACRTYAYRVDGGELHADPANTRSGAPWSDPDTSALWMPDWRIDRFATPRPMIARARRSEGPAVLSTADWRIASTWVHAGPADRPVETVLVASADDEDRLDGLVTAAENLVAAGLTGPVLALCWEPHGDGRALAGAAASSLDLVERSFEAVPGTPVTEERRVLVGVGGRFVAEALTGDTVPFGLIVVESPSEAALAALADGELADLAGKRAFVGAGREGAERDRARDLAGLLGAAGAEVTLAIDDADPDARLLASRMAGILR